MNNTVKSQDVINVAKPLDPILSDNSVWEIMIDSHERVLVERDGRVEQVESPFSSAEELQAFIDGLFGLYGIKLDSGNPVGYLRLPDNSRAMAILPPNAVEGPHVVLRRISGPRPTWDNLIEWKFLPQQAFDLLKSAVKARVNILASGGTGSGKKTLASRIAELSPAEERLIVVEQAYGMQIQHPRVVRLEAGGPAGLTFADVLTAAMRMRPDRLIFSELDGPVAASALQSFGVGYDGSLTTIHATSVEDALNRLESFCLMANLGLGLNEIRQLIASGIQLILNQELFPQDAQRVGGKRKLVEVVELRGVENHRYVLQPLMHYNRETQEFDFTGVKPSWEG